MRALAGLPLVLFTLTLPLAAHAGTDYLCHGKLIDGSGVAGDIDIRFHLSPRSSTVELPAQMMRPPVSSETLPDARLTIHELEISDTAFVGYVLFGGDNRLHFRIDRQTSEMEMSGGANVSGTCEGYDTVNMPPRRPRPIK